MTSIANMIKLIAGLQDTKDVSEWESEFIWSVVEKTDNGKCTTALSGKQVEVIQRIYNKHFS